MLLKMEVTIILSSYFSPKPFWIYEYLTTFSYMIFFFKDTRKTYATVINRRDHLVRKDGGGYELEDYKKHPEQYTSIFADQVNIQ